MAANIEKHLVERNWKSLIKGEEIRKESKKFPEKEDLKREMIMDNKHVQEERSELLSPTYSSVIPQCNPFLQESNLFASPCI
jgi:hypothetical protein